MNSNGFTCPFCGGTTRVVETRRVPGGLRRRRQCLVRACGAKSTTAEYAVGQAKPDGAQKRGPFVAVRSRDLQAIAAIVNDVLVSSHDENPEDTQTDEPGDAAH